MSAPASPRARASAQADELRRAARSVDRLARRVSQAQRAGALVVIVQDADEALALAEVEAAAATCKPVQVISSSNPEATSALEEHAQARGTLVLLDFLAVYGGNPLSVRMLREVALQRRKEGERYSRLILIEQPGTEVPAGLAGDSEIIRPELPTIDQLREELDGFLAGVDPSNLDGPAPDAITYDERYLAAGAVAGLPRHEAARLFARCVVETRSLDPAWLRAEKARRVSTRLGGALTFEQAASADVGGLDALKRWLGSRKAAFGSRQAREWGLPEPKGLLLLGTPGSGKSLTARTIAREWELPLLRLDAGRLFGSLVGQSEAQTRLAIEAAEACAPCVLWIDEIEKGLAGGGGGAGDSGTSSRVFGALLTWLQEKTSPVFVVATANRIAQLPPELLRKGRFDEIFFVGQPTARERAEILGIHLGIHLGRRGRMLDTLEIEQLAAESDGFSGAELEQAVIEGMFAAYSEGRELTAEDVRAALVATTPLSVTMAEEIARLQNWARSRARPATSPDDGEPALDPSGAFDRPGLGRALRRGRPRPGMTL